MSLRGNPSRSYRWSEDDRRLIDALRTYLGGPDGHLCSEIGVLRAGLHALAAREGVRILSSPPLEEPAGEPAEKVVSVVDPFVACEEDRPVPVKTHFRKPLTLLDPDAEVLSSFES